VRQDRRLSVALHVLLHLSEAEGAVTSETLGPLLEKNPVVLRRTLAGLREAGIVASEKGHGGGWTLTRPLATVTLADVYAALGLATPFRIGHRPETPRCVLERAANLAIGESLAEAEALLLARLGTITVADILAGACASLRGGPRHAHSSAHARKS
jgi:DNA-binding IscR family transcriptional regulator